MTVTEQALDTVDPVSSVDKRRWIPRWKESDRGYMTIAIGCTGGQHRSVYMTERVARSLRDTHDPVNVRHSALTRVGIEH